eukprot:g3458.t1
MNPKISKQLFTNHNLTFKLSKYLDPRSRINARTALQDKEAWIPKQVLQYVKDKREKVESLKWSYSSLGKVVREDKFELVKWAGTFNEFVKETLCRRAVRLGKLHMLKWARKQQPPLPWGSNCLCSLAFKNGHYDTLKWLIENSCPWDDQKKMDFLRCVGVMDDKEEWKNVDVNQVVYDENGKTALHYSSEKGHIEVVKAIVSHPKFTNINQVSQYGHTALHLASRGGYTEVAKVILSHPKFQANENGDTALHCASMEGHIKIVNVLLSHSKFTNVNQANEDGQTALHLASENGHVEVVKAILSHSKFTNANQADEYERTALLTASRWGHTEVAKAILSHPKFTNVNQVSMNGNTALHWACNGGHIEVVKAILSHPKFTNVNQADNDGQTAFHLASRGGHTEVANVILSHPKFASVR